MASLLTLAVCLLIGVGLQRVKNFPANAHQTLGTLILYVPLPALCLLTLPKLQWNLSLLSLASVMWIIFLIPFFLVPIIGKKMNWNKDLIGCLMLTAGFCNSSFVGFPIIESLYGQEGLKDAIFIDQAGTFLIVSTFGIWIALTYSSGHMRKRMLIQKVFFFPPFIAFLIGISLSLVGLKPEGVLLTMLEKIASLLTPLALICVGLQLKWNDFKDERKHLVLGLSYKLFIAPMIIFCLFWALGIEKNILHVSVMEGAMGPMITSSILAQTYHLRPKLAGMMVGVGIPLSFLTLTMWYAVLSHLS